MSNSDGLTNEVNRSNHHGPTVQVTFKVLVDPLQMPIGLVKRAGAKCFKESLNGLMRGLWDQAQANLVQLGPTLDTMLVYMVQVLDKYSNEPESSIRPS
ncbi:hypothetical protein J1N35_000650 [Gossypium stocksii]|uniref:Uncharacterized protein n=1 Tax=Gossypium stocksii TaxID=47602 RepID=A0A9D4AKA3_9ROSI|nr:hypothetical protein J1N35_000650 [Gossypium stocksii]